MQEAIAVGTTNFFIGNLYIANPVIKFIQPVNQEKF